MPNSADKRSHAIYHRRLRLFSHMAVVGVSVCALIAAGVGGCTKRDATPPGPHQTEAGSAGNDACTYVAMAQAPTTTPSGKLRSSGGWGPVSGSRIVLFDLTTSDLVSNLTGEFISAGRPDCDYDGKHILFAGTHVGDNAPAVWEIGIDGVGLRKVTDCPGGCAQAIYLSTIFTIDAAAPEDQIAFVTVPTKDAPAAVYTCRLDGTNAQPITFAPKGASDPTLLSDGRLVFSMAAPVEDEFQVEDGNDVRNTALFTINTDGTDVFPFAGLHGKAASRTTPCQVDGNTVVYSECDGAGCNLVSVSRSRSLHSQRVLRTEPGERIYSASPMPEGRMLISHRTVTQGSIAPWRLSIVDVSDGEISATLSDDPDWHALGAVWIGPRPKPPGRSSVVNHDGLIAQLYCLNAYLSGRTVRDQGDFDIKSIQIFSQSQTPGSAAEPHLLGEAQVEPDGSFFVELPARVPLQLASIGREGEVVDRMRSIFWVMPGERRGCIGCHEDREMTPPNRHVFALRRPVQRIGSRSQGQAQNANLQGFGVGSR